MKSISELEEQYRKLAEDWRQINTIVWAVPAVAVSIMTGILVGAYDKLNGLPRVVSLSLGSLLLFALAVELVKKRILMNVISRSLQDLEIKLQIMPFPYSTPGLIERISSEKNNPDDKDPIYRLFKWSYAREYLTIVTFVAAIALATLSYLETEKTYASYYPWNYLIGIIIVIIVSAGIVLYRLYLRGERITSDKPTNDYKVCVEVTKPRLSKEQKQKIVITVTSKKTIKPVKHSRIRGEVCKTDVHALDKLRRFYG